MDIVEFVNYLRKLDINLFLEGDRLRCNAPQGAITAELKSEMSGRKAEIISFLQQANIQTTTTAIAPISRTEQNSFPLSFAQLGLWFLDQLQPNSSFYNIPLTLRLRGQLNIGALESSINEIIQRHEALRTNFATGESQPVQVIASSLNCQMQVVNLLYLPEMNEKARLNDG